MVLLWKIHTQPAWSLSFYFHLISLTKQNQDQKFDTCITSSFLRVNSVLYKSVVEIGTYVYNVPRCLFIFTSTQCMLVLSDEYPSVPFLLCGIFGCAHTVTGLNVSCNGWMPCRQVAPCRGQVAQQWYG